MGKALSGELSCAGTGLVVFWSKIWWCLATFDGKVVSLGLRGGGFQMNAAE